MKSRFPFVVLFSSRPTRSLCSLGRARMTSPLYPFKGNANDHAFLKTLQHSQAARVRHHQSQKNERWRVECERIKNQTQDDQPINRALNLQHDTYHQRGWEGTQRPLKPAKDQFRFIEQQLRDIQEQQQRHGVPSTRREKMSPERLAATARVVLNGFQGSKVQNIGAKSMLSFGSPSSPQAARDAYFKELRQRRRKNNDRFAFISELRKEKSSTLRS